MTVSRIPAVQGPLVSPVIDYEPPPAGVATCPPPTPESLRRRTSRASPGRRVDDTAGPAAAVPPRGAVAFADAALRRVLEVIDRRRPVTQLRPLLAPALIDTVIAMTRSSHTGARHRGRSTAARLRRVGLRMVDDPFVPAAEVFGTYSRGVRVLAIAARIELSGERWRIVALELR